MTQRYVQCLQQIQQFKKQLNTARQKCQIAQTTLTCLTEQNRSLHLSLDNQQQTIIKLTNHNKRLQQQKQSILAEYSNNVQEIKQDINRKQQYINQLKQSSMQALTNDNFMKKQLTVQLEKEFEGRLESKDKKIEELVQQVQKIGYEKNLDKEKYVFKVNALQGQLREQQTKHLMELEEMTEKLYTKSQTRPAQDKDMIRKMKRQTQDLRRRTQQLNQQLTHTLQQKYQLQRQLSQWVQDHNKYVVRNEQQLKAYKNQFSKISQSGQSGIRNERGSYIVKDREKELRRLRNQVEELHEELVKKQKKLASVEVDYVELMNQVKRLKKGSREREVLERENQQLRRQLDREERSLSNGKKERSKKAGISVTQNGQFNEFLRVQQTTNSLASGKVGVGVRNDSPPSPSLQAKLGEGKQSNELITLRRAHNQLREKYIQLKKRYVNLQRKFNTANAKVVQLLNAKIQLGSPTAASRKVFEFPTQGKPQGDHHENLSRDFYEKQMQMTNPVTAQQHHIHNIHMRTLGSQPAVLNDGQQGVRDNRSISSNGGSYYERSLKIRHSLKHKTIKCSNHDSCEK